MDFIYLCETEIKRPLAIALGRVGKWLRERDDRGQYK
jgi:hypothetical protein